MKSIDKTKARAVADNSVIKNQRRQIIASSYDWIKHSIANGFYLEATTIVESLISDRLESRLSFLMGTNIGFQNLQNLIDKTHKEDTDSELKLILRNKNTQKTDLDLEDWTKIRNQVLHEIGKLEDSNFLSWEDRLKKAKNSAEEGLKLLRKLDKRVTQLRKESINK